jgi:endonuclease YncB( thermonuclease family)
VQVISHGVGKFGRCLGEIDFACPDSLTMKNLNKQLIEEGHAIEYHGGKR